MSNKKTEIAIKNDATDIAVEESKRGRRPLTHAEMSGRLTTPLPHDSQAGHFILDTFGATGYKVFALVYPTLLGIAAATLGYQIFKRGDLP